MKKIITILVMACSLLVATSPTNAQATLSFSLTADSVGYGVPNFSIEVFGNLHNLTGSTLKFKAVRLTNDLPSGWAYNQFCLGSYCYSPVISSAIDSMPGDSSKK